MSYVITDGTRYCFRDKNRAVHIVADLKEATTFTNRQVAQNLLSRATKKLSGFYLEELVASEPAKNEQAKTEPAKNEQAKAEPAKNEQAKAEPVKAESQEKKSSQTSGRKTRTRKTRTKSEAPAQAKETQAPAEEASAPSKETSVSAKDAAESENPELDGKSAAENTASASDTAKEAAPEKKHSRNARSRRRRKNNDVPAEETVSAESAVEEESEQDAVEKAAAGNEKAADLPADEEGSSEDAADEAVSADAAAVEEAHVSAVNISKEASSPIVVKTAQDIQDALSRAIAAAMSTPVLPRKKQESVPAVQAAEPEKPAKEEKAAAETVMDAPAETAEPVRETAGSEPEKREETEAKSEPSEEQTVSSQDEAAAPASPREEGKRSGRSRTRRSHGRGNRQSEAPEEAPVRSESSDTESPAPQAAVQEKKPVVTAAEKQVRTASADRPAQNQPQERTSSGTRGNRSQNSRGQSRRNSSRNYAPLDPSEPDNKRRMFTTAERNLVYNRTEGHCGICGKFIPLEEYTIDHIIPLSKGGTNDTSNLQACCGFCNKAKDDTVGDEFFKRIQRIFMYQAKLRYDKKKVKQLKKMLKELED